MESKVIESKDNPRIKRVSRLLSDKEFRYSEREYVVEGLRAVQDSKDIKEVYVLEGAEIPPLKILKRFIVKKSVFNLISSTENSQGIVAAANLRLGDSSQIRKDSRYIFLDQLQDPGNMGTIIRTAAAFNIRGIIFLKGTTDPFSPKVVRASASAIGKLDVIRLESYGQLENFNVIAADKDGISLREFSWPEGFILAIGNEGKGLSKELLSIAKSRVAIPIAAQIESLNAAVSCAILLYEATKRSI